MTDRGFWVAGIVLPWNVRRLMYQSLIWSFVLRDDAGGLGPAFDAEDLQCLADALVDRVRRDIKLGRDLLGVQVLVDEAKAIELARRQPGDALSHWIARAHVRVITRRVMRFA